MALARRLTSLGPGRPQRGRRSRCASRSRGRWSSCPPTRPTILRDIVADELNVDEIDTADELSEVIQFELVPNFRTLGPRLGERVKELKPALAALDGGAAAAALEAGRADHGRPRRASRSSWHPTTCSCGSGASRASPSRARAARWWPST